jgi:hypothetical protein
MSSVVSASRSRTSSAKRKAQIVQQVTVGNQQAGPQGDGVGQREAAKQAALENYCKAMARRDQKG